MTTCCQERLVSNNWKGTLSNEKGCFTSTYQMMIEYYSRWKYLTGKWISTRYLSGEMSFHQLLSTTNSWSSCLRRSCGTFRFLFPDNKVPSLSISASLASFAGTKFLLSCKPNEKAKELISERLSESDLAKSWTSENGQATTEDFNLKKLAQIMTSNFACWSRC